MTEPEVRSQRERSLHYMFSKVPFTRALQLELLEWSEDGVIVRMPYQDLIDNGGHTSHGGAVAALMDNAGAAAVWAGHDYAKGTRSSTVSLTVNFVGATKDGPVIATARCVRRAKELNFVEVSAESQDGRPIASGVMVYRIAP
jgi:uncharacterized protein (TIGR00369 family)